MEIPSVDYGYHDNYLAMVLYQYDGILSILHRYRLWQPLDGEDKVECIVLVEEEEVYTDNQHIYASSILINDVCGRKRIGMLPIQEV